MRLILSFFLLVIFTIYSIYYIGIAQKEAIAIKNSIIDTPKVSKEELASLKLKLKERMLRYENFITKTHLENGMVVVRDQFGYMRDNCDSLLFSSLRMVAAHKAQMTDTERRAWHAIKYSETSPGQWHRHPLCFTPPLSRDMTLGLIWALWHRKGDPEAKAIIERLITHLDKNNGFIADGPMDVSFLTSGMYKYLLITAERHGIDKDQIPLWMRLFAFSSLDIDAIFTERGYRSHLVALALHFEIKNNSISKIRKNIVSSRLCNLDPNNLYFKWLRYKSANAIDDHVNSSFIKELLSMKEFPENRLPGNCDRKADYLWQRNSDEYPPIVDVCEKTFTGVDFLWLGALLLEEQSGT